MRSVHSILGYWSTFMEPWEGWLSKRADWFGSHLRVLSEKSRKFEKELYLPESGMIGAMLASCIRLWWHGSLNKPKAGEGIEGFLHNIGLDRRAGASCIYSRLYPSDYRRIAKKTHCIGLKILYSLRLTSGYYGAKFQNGKSLTILQGYVLSYSSKVVSGNSWPASIYLR